MVYGRAQPKLTAPISTSLYELLVLLFKIHATHHRPFTARPSSMYLWINKVSKQAEVHSRLIIILTLWFRRNYNARTSSGFASRRDYTSDSYSRSRWTWLIYWLRRNVVSSHVIYTHTVVIINPNPNVIQKQKSFRSSHHRRLLRLVCSGSIDLQPFDQ